jgi:hypothetical protein
MLGRKTYTRDEIDHGKTAIEHQFAAYRKLVKAMPAPTSDKKIAAALEPFEALFFNNLTLVLDRYFVHRLSGPKHEGKDGNPLNEVRIICDSLITNDGVMRSDTQIKLPPERSITKLQVGDRIAITAAQFEALSTGFFTELEQRFLEEAS